MSISVSPKVLDLSSAQCPSPSSHRSRDTSRDQHDVTSQSYPYDSEVDPDDPGSILSPGGSPPPVHSSVPDRVSCTEQENTDREKFREKVEEKLKYREGASARRILDIKSHLNPLGVSSPPSTPF